MSLPQVFIASLEAALNKYLALDEQTLLSMSHLEGKIIEIYFLDIQQSIFLFPGDSLDGDGLMVLSDFDGEADTRIIGTALSLIKLGLVKNSSDVLFSGDVRIEGDLRLGQQFNKILAQINIDWEEQLSTYIGDIAAHQIGNGLSKLSHWIIRNKQSIELDTGEYFQEEIQLLPSAAEVNYFINAVDTVRQKSDLLQARVDRLIGIKKENKND